MTHRHLLPDKLIGEGTLEVSSVPDGTRTTVTLHSKDGIKVVGEILLALSGQKTAAASKSPPGELLSNS